MAIKTGKVPESLAQSEIGPVNHSRWLTTGTRICRIYVSQHGLSKENTKKLKIIVDFIIGVYIPNWFNIKVNHSWTEGPRHVLHQLELLRSQSKAVVEIVKDTVNRGAWYAHSETILQTLLCSDDEEERRFAVKKILEIRGPGDDSQVGSSSIRLRKTPLLNFKSKRLIDLIDWSKELVTEPPLTVCLSREEINKFLDLPMEVPKWPSHTQSVERLVKKVTEAADNVFSEERRNDYIRSQEVIAEMMKQNRSKQDLVNLVKFRRSES